MSPEDMKNYHHSFSLEGIINSFRNAFRGFSLLLKYEYNLYIQIALAICAIVAGFLFNISMVEWAIQTTAIGLVIFSELVNTAIEKTMDLVHPTYDIRVKNIKDLAAGTVLFTVAIALSAAAFIYLPKIF